MRHWKRLMIKSKRCCTKMLLHTIHFCKNASKKTVIYTLDTYVFIFMLHRIDGLNNLLMKMRVQGNPFE